MIPDWAAARLRAQHDLKGITARPTIEIGQQLETEQGRFAVTGWNWPIVSGITPDGETVFAIYNHRGGWDPAEYVDGKWSVMRREDAA